MIRLPIERHRGICRTVYLVGRWAIKTPRLHVDLRSSSRRMWAVSRAVQANLSEREWSGVDGVAPVLHSWLGGLVNVYPRCKPWPEGAEPNYDSIGNSWLPRDRKPSNVGLLNGKPVWLDYDGSWNGCPHSRDSADLARLNDEKEAAHV